MNAAEILAKLKTMARAAGEAFYERACLAKALLEDRDWLAGPQFRGDETLARAYLDKDCFGDLAGSMGLHQLLEIVTKFPNKEDWQHRKFNLKVLWAETISPKEKEEIGERTKWKQKALNAIEDKRVLEIDLRSERKTSVAQAGQIEALQARVRQLENENAELKGRVNALEKALGFLKQPA